MGASMASTLTKRELSEEILFGGDDAKALELYVKSVKQSNALSPKAGVAGLSVVSLPDFYKDSVNVNDNSLSSIHLPSFPSSAPEAVPSRGTRKAPLVVRVNRILQTALIAMCGLAILGYGVDVAVSSDVTRSQEQARRLSEENSELSAKLLKTVAYYSLQQSGPARFGLRSPEHVLIVPEKTTGKVKAFKPSKYHLPLMSGY
jgi:hypothetical protein